MWRSRSCFGRGVVPPGPFIVIDFSSYQLNVLCAPDYFADNEITLKELCTHDLLLREKGVQLEILLIVVYICEDWQHILNGQV